MHSGKLNSTELFSSVQFPAVHWTDDDLRRFGDEIGGRRRFFTIGTHLWIGQSTQCLSLDENRRRLGTAVGGLSTAVDGSWLSRTCDGRRRSSQLVAGSMHSGKLNWTELNDPVQFSSVEFSSVFRCALDVDILNRKLGLLPSSRHTGRR